MSRSLEIGFRPGVAPWLAVASLTTAIATAGRMAKGWWDAQRVDDRAYLSPLGAAAARHRYDGVTVAQTSFAEPAFETTLPTTAQGSGEGMTAAIDAGDVQAQLDGAVRAIEAIGASAQFAVRRMPRALPEAPVVLEFWPLQVSPRALVPQARRRG